MRPQQTLGNIIKPWRPQERHERGSVVLRLCFHEERARSFTLVVLLREGAGDSLGGGAGGVERVVGGSGDVLGLLVAGLSEYWPDGVLELGVLCCTSRAGGRAAAAAAGAGSSPVPSGTADAGAAAAGRYSRRGSTCPGQCSRSRRDRRAWEGRLPMAEGRATLEPVTRGGATVRRQQRAGSVKDWMEVFLPVRLPRTAHSPDCRGQQRQPRRGILM